MGRAGLEPAPTDIMIEIIYTFFLLSGFIKFFLLYYGKNLFPVDFTLLCAFLLAAAYIFRVAGDFYYKNKFYLLQRARAIVACLLIFYTWMVVTLLYTASPQYSYIKLGIFPTIAIAFIFPQIWRGFRTQLFFYWFVVVGTGAVVLFSTFFAGLYEEYLKQPDEYYDFIAKYLDMGYLAGAIMLVLLFACPRLKPWLKILLIGVNGWMLVVSAARGPLLTFFLVLFLRAVIGVFEILKRKWNFNFKTALAVALVFVVVIMGATYMVRNNEALLQRTAYRLQLVFDPQSAAVEERINLVNFSLKNILAGPADFVLGQGIGSFGILYDHIDKHNYPHNILLEILFETGIVGFVVFLAFFFLYLKQIGWHLHFLTIFLYFLLNSLKSASLIDLRIMFGIFGVMLLVVSLEKDKREKT